MNGNPTMFNVIHEFIIAVDYIRGTNSVENVSSFERTDGVSISQKEVSVVEREDLRCIL